MRCAISWYKIPLSNGPVHFLAKSNLQPISQLARSSVKPARVLMIKSGMKVSFSCEICLNELLSFYLHFKAYELIEKLVKRK